MSRNWQVGNVVGNITANIEFPVFYQFDQISKSFSHYFKLVENKASLEECIGLECVAVWNPEHVEERLLAVSLGKDSIWETSLRAENQL